MTYQPTSTECQLLDYLQHTLKPCELPEENPLTGYLWSGVLYCPIDWDQLWADEDAYTRQGLVLCVTHEYKAHIILRDEDKFGRAMDPLGEDEVLEFDLAEAMFRAGYFYALANAQHKEGRTPPEYAYEPLTTTKEVQK